MASSAAVKGKKNLGCQGRPERGAEGTLNVAPKAQLPRRAREIQPKAGISRVFVYLFTQENIQFYKKLHENLQATYKIMENIQVPTYF